MCMLNTFYIPHNTHSIAFLLSRDMVWATVQDATTIISSPEPLSLSHTLPYSVNGCPTENIIFNPFVSVRMRFVSVVHSAMSITHSENTLFVRRGPINPAESFVHAQNLQRTPPEKGARWMYGSNALVCVLFGPRTFLFLYLSSSHPLMSGGPDSRPDYYLTYNGSTGGVPDIDRMFSGRLLTRNTWKLTNNGSETVVNGLTLGKTSNYTDFELR